jgi:hypothetical protein
MEWEEGRLSKASSEFTFNTVMDWLWTAFNEVAFRFNSSVTHPLWYSRDVTGRDAW